MTPFLPGVGTEDLLFGSELATLLKIQPVFAQRHKRKYWYIRDQCFLHTLSVSIKGTQNICGSCRRHFEHPRALLSIVCATICTVYWRKVWWFLWSVSFAIFHSFCNLALSRFRLHFCGTFLVCTHTVLPEKGDNDRTAASRGERSHMFGFSVVAELVVEISPANCHHWLSDIQE